MNQEILGTKTTVPWAVIFGHPADGSIPTPRHPVQLYEALFYFILAAILFLFQKPLLKKNNGKLLGIFLTLLFGFRFFIEYFKVEQSAQLSHFSLLSMGQILSIPFFFLGAFLLFRKK
jgi:prolipoprotein diacylglyceryltransferase